MKPKSRQCSGKTLRRHAGDGSKKPTAIPPNVHGVKTATFWRIRTTMARSLTSTHCGHTCGAWLAMAGVHPKVVQTVMRHGSITLTMDTYGHLFPGQEADAIAKVQDLITAPLEALRATGTDDVGTGGEAEAQRQAQHSGRGSRRHGASECDEKTATQDDNSPGDGNRNALQVAKIGDDVRGDATTNVNGRGGDSNPHGGYPPEDFKSGGYSTQRPPQATRPPKTRALLHFLSVARQLVSPVVAMELSVY